MPHLTAQDKTFFKEHGYLVKNDVVPERMISSALDVIWEHMKDVDRNDPATWIKKGYRVVPCGQNDTVKATLYEAPVFEMAEELVGKDRLVRGGGAAPQLNFPDPDQEWKPPGGHLDGYYTPTNGVPEGTVGACTVCTTLYLGAVGEREGGFTVWPGTHRRWAEYFKTHSLLSLKGGGAPFDLGEGLSITGPPGTLVFWHYRLSHSASPNCGRNIRMALISRLRRKDVDDIMFETPDDMWTHWDGIEGP
ncbi:MAG: hypothetical protein EXS64_15815 [Candidatus Latescibacteria bacterium]|nr:hypothetical protein [Candidatus Latescibacterota bacterium]